MGFRVGSQCFGSWEAASAAWCAQSNYPIVFPQGDGTSMVYSCQGSAGPAPDVPGPLVIVAQMQDATGTPVFSESRDVNAGFVACNELEEAQDLAVLFAVALPAVLAVYLIRQFILRLVAPL